MSAVPGLETSYWMLSALLDGIGRVAPADDTVIEGLAIDSREVKPGDLFLALKGERSHGLRHLSQALERGAVAVAWEPHNGIAPLNESRPAIAIDNLSQLAGVIADRFFGHPSSDLSMVGITGTDGKTSVSHFLGQALDTDDARCGILGTLGYGLFGELGDSLLTTPDAVRLQVELDTLRNAGARHAVMEVSSHALEQGRTNGTAFDVAVLTNLSRDHLDYHGDAESYAAAKRKLFEMPDLQQAVLNLADPFGAKLADTLSDRLDLLGYGLAETAARSRVAMVRAHDVELSQAGLSFRAETPHGGGQLRAELLGRFNVFNLLAALTTLLALGIPLNSALQRLGRTAVVPGRIEPFGAGREGPLVVVDFAHTPAALRHVLTALREHCEGQLWCVFGCGGDRDAGKRPLMARAVEQHADHVILTDDNPRHESAAAIVCDAMAGFSDPSSVSVIHDRAQAIESAVANAVRGDIVLVAGKGHESGQIVGDEVRPFSDREFVSALVVGGGA